MNINQTCLINCRNSQSFRIDLYYHLRTCHLSATMTHIVSNEKCEVKKENEACHSAEDEHIKSEGMDQKDDSAVQSAAGGISHASVKQETETVKVEMGSTSEVSRGEKISSTDEVSQSHFCYLHVTILTNP